jgi:hypothetical protein
MNINYLRNFYVSRVTYLTTPRSAPAWIYFKLVKITVSQIWLAVSNAIGVREGKNQGEETNLPDFSPIVPD